jgi:hypothetical protein
LLYVRRVKERRSLSFYFLPLSFEGEGDKGGGLINIFKIEASVVKRYTIFRTFCGDIYAIL